MGDEKQSIQTALEQYAVVESIVNHLCFDTAVNVSRINKLWNLCANRRLDESRVRHGKFAESRISNELESLVSEMGNPSIVMIFSKRLTQKNMEAIVEGFIGNKSDLNIPLFVGLQPYENLKLAKPEVKGRMYSWIALPRDAVITAFLEEEFFTSQDTSSKLKDTTILFTSEMLELSSYTIKRRKIEGEIKSQIVGGVFGAVFCNHTNRKEINRVDFLAVSVSSIPDRLSIEFGETAKDCSDVKTPLPLLSSVIVFPCAGISGRSNNRFLNGLRCRFPRCSAVIGGFTGGEWFGQFTTSDLQDASGLLDRVQHGYSCFYVAFVSI